ncbi:MAG: PEP-CTERM sorting domain-containing protein [Deltaproteobacteria bacterium]|nr:MAG: PEP-CTERM sorting domain-containing protein [Deltaproteobacteria bacterium]
MKTFSIASVVLLLIFGIIGTGRATLITYVDTFDWNEIVTETGRTLAVIDNPSYSFQFEDFDLPEDAVLRRAKLILKHKGNRAEEPREFWTLGYNGTTFDLEPSIGEWIRQRFILDPESFSEGPNPLLFTLTESTPGDDKIRLDLARIRIRYEVNETPPNPVPEPATILLLGSGMMALAWRGRKRLRRS